MTAAGKPLEIWFQDEARVGQKGTLAYVWARCGTRPRGGSGHPLRMGLPVRGRMPGTGGRRGAGHACANTEAMNLHLIEIVEPWRPALMRLSSWTEPAGTSATSWSSPTTSALVKLPP